MVKIGGTGIDAHAPHRLFADAGHPFRILQIGKNARRPLIEGAASGVSWS